MEIELWPPTCQRVLCFHASYACEARPITWEWTRTVFALTFDPISPKSLSAPRVSRSTDWSLMPTQTTIDRSAGVLRKGGPYGKKAWVRAPQARSLLAH